MGISKKVYMAMIAMLVFGSGIPLFAKLIDLSPIEGKLFEHPYLQSAVMFVGEALSIVVFKIFGSKDSGSERLIPVQRREDSIYSKYGKKLFMLSGIFDLISSTLAFVAIILTAPSIYQMLRGGNILFVALYSLIFLKRRFYKHQCLGLFLTTLGLFILGIVSIVYKAETAKSPALGIVLILISHFFAAGCLVSEEKFMENIQINPLEVVGIEGMTGMCVFLVILLIFNLIPCDSENLCSEGYIENTIVAFQEISISPSIGVYLCFIMLSVLVFDSVGVYVTKEASAVARSIVSSCRTIVIWIISLIVGWEDFLIGELLGFGVLIIGSMIYNEVIILKFWGLDKGVNQEKNIEGKDEVIELREEESLVLA